MGPKLVGWGGGGVGEGGPAGENEIERANAHLEGGDNLGIQGNKEGREKIGKKKKRTVLTVLRNGDGER